MKQMIRDAAKVDEIEDQRCLDGDGPEIANS